MSSKFKQIIRTRSIAVVTFFTILYKTPEIIFNRMRRMGLVIYTRISSAVTRAPFAARIADAYIPTCRR